jgi:hypothetical protein
LIRGRLRSFAPPYLRDIIIAALRLFALTHIHPMYLAHDFVFLFLRKGV